MGTLIFGFIFIVIVMVAAVFTTFVEANVDLVILYNIPSIIMIFVGTIVLFFFIAPWQQVKSTFKSVLLLFRSYKTKTQIRLTLNELSKGKRSGFENVHPLIDRALVLWQATVDRSTFETELLKIHDENDICFKQGCDVVSKLGKYPPSLGMTGTVLGLVAMLANLSGSVKNIGPAMALALVSSLFGLLISNVILAPLADRLKILGSEQEEISFLVFTSLLQINDGVPLSALGTK